MLTKDGITKHIVYYCIRGLILFFSEIAIISDTYTQIKFLESLTAKSFFEVRKQLIVAGG